MSLFDCPSVSVSVSVSVSASVSRSNTMPRCQTSYISFLRTALKILSLENESSTTNMQNSAMFTR